MALATAAVIPTRRARSRWDPPTPWTSSTAASTTPPAVANCGLLLAATLAGRLGIEQAADALIDLGELAGAHRPGRKLLTLVHAMLGGGDCIDDADLLRCGATSQVLGPPGHGALHLGDPPALVHLRARPPARPAHRAAPHARGRLVRAPAMGR